MQKARIRLVLRNDKKNSAGQVPIYLSITIDGKRSFEATGHFISAKQWDAKNEQVKDTHTLAEEINRDITAKKREAMQTVIDAGLKNIRVSSRELKTGEMIFSLLRTIL